VPAAEESVPRVNELSAACVRIPRKSARPDRTTVKDTTVKSAQYSASSLEKQKLQIV
jgi:hypothetical protein